MKKIRVLIADDHAIVRAGLAALLGAEKDIAVVGQARNGIDAAHAARRLKPDVVIMDLMLPELDGVEATAEVTFMPPGAKVIVLATFGTSDGIANALRNGAKGVILKDADAVQLVAAVRKVAGGGEFVSPKIRKRLAVNPPIPKLTMRQVDVLTLIICGKSNPEIAHRLGIRQDGVRDHVRDILHKLNAANRVEAVAIALHKHLLKAERVEKILAFRVGRRIGEGEKRE